MVSWTHLFISSNWLLCCFINTSLIFPWYTWKRSGWIIFTCWAESYMQFDWFTIMICYRYIDDVPPHWQHFCFFVTWNKWILFCCCIRDHQRHKKVARTSVTLFSSYHILTSSVIYFQTGTVKNGTYLFIVWII